MKYHVNLRAESDGQTERHDPHAIELHLARGYVQIYKHDHENEQHHDAADVQNHLHDKKKFGVKLQENSGGGQKSGDQENRAVYGVPASDHQNRGDYREGREKIK